ncbi:hypothetical protein GQ472_02320 [archaeon]|nr:hypothetical protein [archaeon]
MSNERIPLIPGSFRLFYQAKDFLSDQTPRIEKDLQDLMTDDIKLLFKLYEKKIGYRKLYPLKKGLKFYNRFDLDRGKFNFYFKNRFEAEVDKVLPDNVYVFEKSIIEMYDNLVGIKDEAYDFMKDMNNSNIDIIEKDTFSLLAVDGQGDVSNTEDIISIPYKMNELTVKQHMKSIMSAIKKYHGAVRSFEEYCMDNRLELPCEDLIDFKDIDENTRIFNRNLNSDIFDISDSEYDSEKMFSAVVDMYKHIDKVCFEINACLSGSEKYLDTKKEEISFKNDT